MLVASDELFLSVPGVLVAYFELLKKQPLEGETGSCTYI